MSVISVKNVHKKFKVYFDKSASLKEKVLFQNRNYYEERYVLRDISMEIEKGEVVALIGKNGCGKSTLLKLLSRIMYPDEGTVTMEGRVASLIELGAGFHPDMSGRENIYTNASIFGLTAKEIDQRIEDIINFSELHDYIDNPVRTYSSGMYMRLAFSVAIHVDADILLIDEILAVGDANFQAKCFNHLMELKDRGVTIVIVTHDLTSIETICSRALWIERGNIEMDSTLKDVSIAYFNWIMKVQNAEELLIDKQSEKLMIDEPMCEQGKNKDFESHNLLISTADNFFDYFHAEMLDTKNQKCNSVKLYGDVTFVFTYLKTENIENYNNFRFYFRSGGSDLTDGIALEELFIIELNKICKVELKVQGINADRGDYFIDIVAASSELKSMRILNVLSFSVTEKENEIFYSRLSSKKTYISDHYKFMKHLIYTPTLRCNLLCQHCSQDHKMNADKEIACRTVSNSLIESDLLKSLEVIDITGGEPFLKEDLKDFVLDITNYDCSTMVHITTNGYFTSRIKDLLLSVKNINKLRFYISIDGLEETHNTIRGNSKSFQNAMNTLKLLKEYNVPVQINTVAQEKNLKELSSLKELVAPLGNHGVIPLISDLSNDGSFHFSTEQISSILGQLTLKMFQKYVLSYGTAKIQNCHAGLVNFTITSSGDVFPCYTRELYIIDSSRESSELMGNILSEKLTDILHLNKKIDVFESVSSRCCGCFNSCEVNREVSIFGMDLSLSEDEMNMLFSLTEDPLYFYDDNNWYPEEGEDNFKFSWMNNVSAKIFLRKKEQRTINIEFLNYATLSGLSLSLYIENELICTLYPKERLNFLKINIQHIETCNKYFTLEFKVSETWTIESDPRTFGIALQNVYYE